MTDRDKLARNNRLTLVLLVLIFCLPVISAWYMVFFTDLLRGGGSTEHGDLIEPPRQLPDTDLAGTGMARDQTLHGKWTLIALADQQCDAVCQENLYRVRQIRLAMGKELERLQRVLLYKGIDDVARENIVNQYPGQLFLSVTDINETFQKTFFQKHTINDHGLFLVDPRGYLMMYYPVETNPSGIIKDLKRLLRISGKH